MLFDTKGRETLAFQHSFLDIGKLRISMSVIKLDIQYCSFILFQFKLVDILLHLRLTELMQIISNSTKLSWFPNLRNRIAPTLRNRKSQIRSGLKRKSCSSWNKEWGLCWRARFERGPRRSRRARQSPARIWSTVRINPSRCRRIRPILSVTNSARGTLAVGGQTTSRQRNSDDCLTQAE